MSNTIAIVTPHLFNIPETFISQHIRKLAPESTVVVYFDGGDAFKLECPVHESLLPDRSNLPVLVRKIATLWSLLRCGYSAALNKRESKKLASFLRGNGVCKVLAEYGPTACAVRYACKMSGADLFVHFHGYDASQLLRKVRYRHSYRRLAKQAKGIISPSKFLADRLGEIGMPLDKICIIPYGVNEYQFRSGDNRDGNLVLAVGRFVEKKAPYRTIEAFSKVVKRHSKARLEMIGEGPLLEHCKEYASTVGVRERVLFHGSANHDFVKNHMRRAALFVQHSVVTQDGDTEGLPVGILEAMASGLPVVTTRHAGIPEAVSQGETGFLVDEHDVHSMAAAISKLLSNSSLREAMGRAGRIRVINNFSAERQLEKLRVFLGIQV